MQGILVLVDPIDKGLRRETGQNTFDTVTRLELFDIKKNFGLLSL